MHLKPEGLLQTAMRSSRRAIFLSLTLLLAASSTGMYAQGSDNKGGVSCFSIHVRLNGKAIKDPLKVTFKTNNAETSTEQVGGCFSVPPDVLSEQAVDVYFTTTGNNVHLSAIATGNFAGPWDVELEDTRFSSDMALPKDARVKNACGVVFHVGKSEKAITQPSCRTQY